MALTWQCRPEQPDHRGVTDPEALGDFPIAAPLLSQPFHFHRELYAAMTMSAERAVSRWTGNIGSGGSVDDPLSGREIARIEQAQPDWQYPGD